MKTASLKRLKRPEEIRAAGNRPAVEWQIGFLKKLPEEAGERQTAWAAFSV